MKTYIITRRTGTWENIPCAHIDTLLWSPSVPIEATAQLCYDESALYVRLSTCETYIRAEETSIIGAPCQDSCLEFFFSPDTERYFNIEFNPNGCMYLGFGGNDLIRLLPEDSTITPVIERFKDGWLVEYSVPVTFIRQFFPDFSLQSGKTMRGNFYKCGDLTVQPHYLAWNPINSETPCFHRPQDFGQLIFE